MDWLYSRVFDVAHFFGYMSKAWKMGFEQGSIYTGDF